jgi:hypothetical protein
LSKRRLVAGGAAATLVYVLAVTLSIATGRHRVRPLYEGTGPFAAYPWVNPPAAFAAGNIVPQTQTQTTKFGPTGFPPVGLSGAASQVILNLQAGSIAPAAGATGVQSVITPLDPATLGPTAPTGLMADGNAYHVTFFEQPANTPVTQLAVPGDILLGVPAPGHRVLFSPDGHAWTIEQTELIGNYLQAEFTGPGWYLAGSLPPTATTLPSRPPAGTGTSDALPIAVGVGILAVVVVAGPIVWRRRRTNQGAST